MNTYRLGGVSSDPKNLVALEFQTLAKQSLKNTQGQQPFNQANTESLPSGILSFQQAQALRTLKFLGSPSVNDMPPGLSIQAQLIQDLKSIKDPDEKAVAIDMLGQAQVIQAITPLLDLISDANPSQVK
ncbi:MAG: hypothetical protein K2X66_07120, partial [Cyanobacteria bacterium]|nr:hypothetical protein [Cyanobacteriota bacterium]